MKNYERIILYALLAICFACIGYLFFNKNSVQENQKIEIKLNWDSALKTINISTIDKPIVYKSGEINIPPAQLQILQSQDTASLRILLQEILPRYYEIRTQKTVSVDDSIQITTIDTLTENAIIGRKLQYKILFPVAQTTIINNPPNRNKLYIGAFGEAGERGIYGFGPKLDYATKKGTLIGLQYNLYPLVIKQNGLISAVDPDKYVFRVSLSQKISLKK